MKQSLADRYDIWAELDQTYHGLWQSMTRFAKNPSGIRKGERVRVGDHNGRRAMAEVINVWSNGQVFLKVDETTIYQVS